jgi:O-antigen/teichoic acid export membrane protein
MAHSLHRIGASTGSERLLINILDSVWAMRYYAVGLALQKGLPAALLPLIIAVFGRDVFAVYVLFYATVQIYGTLTGLGLPLAIVPLWHADADPAHFVARCCRLVLGSTVLAGALLLLVAIFWPGSVIGTMGAPEAVGWLTVFALFYNINLIANGVARSQGRDVAFMASSILGAAVLLCGIGLAWTIGSAGPRSLFLIQIASVASTSIALFGRGGLAFFSIQPVGKKAAAALLAQTAPLIANILLQLLGMSMDKWAARAFFTRDIFASYVIDYQAAITVFFVPTAIGLYAGPKLSAAFAAGDVALMGRDVWKARLMTLAGSLFIGLAMYLYGALSGLGLTSGYWLLLIGFLIEGQYAISSNRVMAEQKFSVLFSSAAASVSIYALLLLSSGLTESVLLLYTASVLYRGAMLVLIDRGGKRHRADLKDFPCKRP